MMVHVLIRCEQAALATLGRFVLQGRDRQEIAIGRGPLIVLHQLPPAYTDRRVRLHRRVL